MTLAACPTCGPECVTVKFMTVGPRGRLSYGGSLLCTKCNATSAFRLAPTLDRLKADLTAAGWGEVR